MNGKTLNIKGLSQHGRTKYPSQVEGPHLKNH